MCVAAANYVINKVNEYNEKNPNARISMTCKRLQKLLYFSDVLYMKQNCGDSMFSDDFYAWPSGPVIPSVYYEFKIYQGGTMCAIDTGKPKSLTAKMREAIDNILKQTWGLDTLDLVERSHASGGPWDSVYCENDPEHKQIISKSDMFAFYKDREIFSK